MEADTVEPSYVEELRLTAFKSFSEALLPLSEFTLLIGRNGSGKSNALDALSVLARLGSGDDVRDALDGSRGDQEPVRGGAEGCAPFGDDAFQLGCRVRTGDEIVDFDVQIWLRPYLRIGWERLSAYSGVHTGKARLDGRTSWSPTRATRRAAICGRGTTTASAGSTRRFLSTRRGC